MSGTCKECGMALMDNETPVCDWCKKGDAFCCHCGGFIDTPAEDLLSCSDCRSGYNLICEEEDNDDGN